MYQILCTGMAPGIIVVDTGQDLIHVASCDMLTIFMGDMADRSSLRLLKSIWTRKWWEGRAPVLYFFFFLFHQKTTLVLILRQSDPYTPCIWRARVNDALIASATCRPLSRANEMMDRKPLIGRKAVTRIARNVAAFWKINMLESWKSPSCTRWDHLGLRTA